MPLYFHGPLNFALVKCRQHLILRVFKKDTLYKYQVGAVLRPISMLIFKKKVKMSGPMMYTCYFARSRFINNSLLECKTWAGLPHTHTKWRFSCFYFICILRVIIVPKDSIISMYHFPLYYVYLFNYYYSFKYLNYYILFTLLLVIFS